MQGKTVATASVIVALAAPVAASADCGCQKYAKQFKRRPYPQYIFKATMADHYVGVRATRRVKEGIYDYARQGYTSEGWCKRFPKHCNALKACLLAGGSVYIKERSEGKSREKATEDAAYSCAVAAAATYLIA